MVAIFTGPGSGFERGSRAVLGSMGLLGDASLGNGAEQVFYNAANGNLLVNHRDEFLVGRGPDVAIARTYNSKGDFSDDNGDNWRQSTDRRVYGQTGTLNEPESTIKRVSGDGSIITFSWKAIQGHYIGTDGEGAYDTLSYSDATLLWTWTDGDTGVSETYEASGTAGSWRIKQQYDLDGNTVTFSYDAGGRLDKATTAEGGYVQYSWDTANNRITAVVSGYTDLTAMLAKTLTRTSYSYDTTTGKLAKITVDLTPTNTTDDVTYTTDYAYDASGRLNSISQKDGSFLDIDYDTSGRVIRFTQTSVGTATRVTDIWYGTGYTRIDDPTGAISRVYYDAKGLLTSIQVDPAMAGAASQIWEFGYNDNGDLISVTDPADQIATYDDYDEHGNAWTQTDRVGTVTRRTWSAANRLLTDTRIGSDQGDDYAYHTTRYAYDDENHLRYTVSPEGRVVEYRYNAVGQQVSMIAYGAEGPDVSGLSISESLSEAELDEWVTLQADRSNAQRTDTFYDHRGNVSQTVSYAVLTKYGEGSGGPLAITAGANTLVTQQADGMYKVEKVLGTDLVYNADAHSAVRTEGDFVLELRPDQTDQILVAGVATTPLANANQTNVNFGFYFNDNGKLYYREGSSVGYFDVSYTTANRYWLVREGDTIAYYRGSTLDYAKSLGALRTVTGVTGSYYFDSSIYNLNASVDVRFTPKPIVADPDAAGAPTTTVVGLVDGMQRITKTGGTSNVFDAAASSTIAATGDFVLRLRPPRKDRGVAAGVSAAPDTGLTRDDIRYGLYFHANGTLYYVHYGTSTSFGYGYNAGDNFWIVRSGTTVSYYKGATLAAALATDPLRTVGNSTGTLYFDSSLYTANASVDVDFAPAQSTTTELTRTFFAYDQAGRLLSRFSEGQNAESFVYDGMGRLTASIDLSGGTTNVLFDDTYNRTVVTLHNQFTRTSTYNKAGELIAVVEAGEYLTTTPADSYAYDRNGRLRIATDSTGRTRYVVYDKAGRKVADVDEYGATVEYRYDLLNRLTATIRYATNMIAEDRTELSDPFTDAEMAELRPAPHADDIWTWHIYDDEGRCIETIDGEGAVTTYAYDRSNRLVKTVAYAEKLTAAQVAGFKTTAPSAAVVPTTLTGASISRTFYDADGNLTGVLDGEGYLHRAGFDWAGRKIYDLTYAEATDPALRDAGTFWQLRGSVDPLDYRINRYVYDSQGQLRFEVDSLSQVTEHRYNRAGLRTTTLSYAGSIDPAATDFSFANVKALVASAGLAADPATRVSWAVHDAAGQLAFAIDAANAVTGFTYDDMGQVVKTVAYAGERETTTLPSLATMASWAAGQAANTANRVTRNYYSDRAGEIRYTVDGEGFVTRFDYDEEGRKIAEIRWNNAITVNDSTTIANIVTAATGPSVTTSFTYNLAGQLNSIYDGNGVRRAFGYNATGTLMWDIADYLGADESRILFEYDGAGRLSARHDAHGTPEVAVTTFTYDAFGNLKTTTDPRGNTSYSYYDKAGREVMHRDAENYLTQTAYNAFGDVISVTRRHTPTTSAADPHTVPAVTTHANDATTTYSYDKLGRVVSENQAGLVTTATTYTAFGEIATVTRGTATTRFEYDHMGRLVETTDAMNFVESYELDAFGQRDSATNKLQATTSYAYDRRGLLVAETLPIGSTNAEGVVAPGNVTNRFEYDSRGNLTRRIEADNLTEERVTDYVYDAADRLTEIRHEAVTVLNPNDHWVTSTDTPVEKFFYDRRGNVIETVAPNDARTLTYYDKLDRAIVEIDAFGAYSSFVYDDSGNLLEQRAYGTFVALPTAPGGTPPAPPAGTPRLTSRSYDKLNRLKTTSVAALRIGAWNGTQYAVTENATVTATLEYDARGNVIKTTDANGAAVFSYFDRVNRKTAQVDQDKRLTTWSFDAEGNVTSETRRATQATGTIGTAAPPTVAAITGQDRITNFTYDKNGRRLTETRLEVVAWTVSSTGLLAAAADESLVQYEYNGLGQVTKKTEATNEAVNYVYDGAGRLIQESRTAYVNQSGTSVTPTVRYSYDGLNNLTLTRQGGATTAAGDRLTKYVYGADGRLASMTDAAGAQYSYFYDVAGNRLKESYSRAESNDTVSLDSVLYTRDLAGRVVSQRIASRVNGAWVNGDSQNIAYDAFGEISQRGLNGLWQEQFSYDGAGRVWRSNSGDGVWRFFLYDGNGNQTATIESEGTDLSAVTSMSTLLNTHNADDALGGAYVDGLNVTINVYDGRGQIVRTILPQRQTSATLREQLETSRLYNAFGEVARETDARNNVTDFLYNTMGRIIQQDNPTVAYTQENGTLGSARPIEKRYYDLSGRLIATENANAKVTKRRLLAGTGYGGSEALTTVEFRPDGSVWRNWYDVYGDARRLRNGLGTDDQPTGGNHETADELRNYDAMGRLTSLVHRGRQLTDYYAYDLHGQRIQHWNDKYDEAVKERSDYDAQGRVTKQTDFGGSITNYTYAWVPDLATGGMATYGGWTKTVVNSSTKTEVESLDYFGRLVDRTDFGGYNHDLTYDKAGRLASHAVKNAAGTITYSTTSYTWLNSGWLGGQTGGGLTATFAYDKKGNRTREILTDSANVSLQNATVTWDAMGRMTGFDDTGPGAASAASIDYEYDLAGNVRRMLASYHALDAQGNVVSTTATQDYLYKYDAMNRFVLTKAGFSGARGSWTVNAGVSGGITITYDAAGNRKTVTQTVTRTKELLRYEATTGGIYYYEEDTGVYPDDGGGDFTPINHSYAATQVETYLYNADGYLSTVEVRQQQLNPITNFQMNLPSVGALPATGVTRASYVRDEMGRVTDYREYDKAGAEELYHRHADYDARSQVTSDTVTARILNATGAYDIHVTATTYQYGSGATYVAGAVIGSTATTTKNGSPQSTATTTNTYVWGKTPSGGSGPRLNVSSIATDYDASTGLADTNYSSTYTYNALGHLGSVAIVNDRSRTVTFVSDGNGLILQRDEADANNTTGDPREFHYYFNGVQLGDVSNNGTSEVDYVTAIARHNAAASSSPFEGGASVSHADFDQSYDPVNGLDYASAATRYTVREGDTLQTIAAGFWGDTSLWYKIAEANGLTGGESLVAGTSLIIPNKVANFHNNASTFEPYDPNDILGNLSPNGLSPTPKAAKKNKCGAFGQILMVVIAVAVSAVTYGMMAPALGTIGAGALAGATGSFISQAVGGALGIVDNFSWKQVAMAGISGAIGGALPSGRFIPGAGNLASDVVRGSLANAASQGIGVATGLQSKFDWAGVAVGGLVGGLAGAANRSLAKAGLGVRVDAISRSTPRNVAFYLNQGLSGLAAAMGAGAARSLAGGTSFGDNIIAALPDVIGSTIGNAIGDAVAGATNRPSDSGDVGAAPTEGRAGARMKNPMHLQEGPPIFVTGTRLSPGEKLWYDATHPWNVGYLAIRSLGWRDEREFLSDINRAAANLNPVRVVTHLVADFAERNGYSGTARVLRGVGEFTAGAQEGLFNSVGNFVEGVIGIVEHPIQSIESGLTTIAGGIHTVFMADVSDVTNWVSGSATRLTEGLASGDPRFYRAMGRDLGETVGTVGTLLAPVPKVGWARGTGASSAPIATRASAATRVESMVARDVPDLPSGSFSISDWTGYPAGVPRPEGPLRILYGDEYAVNVRTGRADNRRLRNAWGLKGKPVEIHEIAPLKFGGSPIDLTNKIVISQALHRGQVTPWWNKLQRDLEGK